MPVWKVAALAACGVLTVGAGLGAACAALVASVDTDLSDTKIDFKLDLGPDVDPDELAAAATTVPMSRADCDTIGRIERDGATLASADLADSRPDFAAYRDRLSRALLFFDADLRQAIAVAHGPLRTHLQLAERNVYEGLVEIRNARTPNDYDPVGRAWDGQRELVIADRLLGRTCGGHLAPDVSQALEHALARYMQPRGPKPSTTTTAA